MLTSKLYCLMVRQHITYLFYCICDAGKKMKKVNKIVCKRRMWTIILNCATCSVFWSMVISNMSVEKGCTFWSVCFCYTIINMQMKSNLDNFKQTQMLAVLKGSCTNTRKLDKSHIINNCWLLISIETMIHICEVDKSLYQPHQKSIDIQ